MKKLTLLLAIFLFVLKGHAQKNDSSRIINPDLYSPMYFVIDSTGNVMHKTDTVPVKLFIYATIQHHRDTSFWKKGYAVKILFNNAEWDFYRMTFDDKKEYGKSYWVTKSYLDEKKKPLPKNMTVWWDNDK